MTPESRCSTSLLAMLAVAVASLAGCGGGNGGAPGASAAAPAEIIGSCNVPATGNCTEWIGSAWKGPTLDRLCASQNGTYLPGAKCPVEGQVGACLRDKGNDQESRFVYYTAFPGYGMKFTPEKVAASGERQCTKFMKGEWSAL